MAIMYKDVLNNVPQWMDDAYLFDKNSVVKKTFTAGAVINGGKAVMIDTDGKIYPFDITNNYHFDKFIGIAETAALIGNPCVVVTQGEIQSVGAGWTPGVAYYIGASGILTNIPPVSPAWVKQVGIGIDTDKIILN